MAETIKSSEHITIMINPFTGEFVVYNHTGYPEVAVEGKAVLDNNADGELVLSLNAAFTLKRGE